MPPLNRGEGCNKTNQDLGDKLREKQDSYADTE